MFLVLCNEAFGYTHEQTLDSSFPLLIAMMRERGYVINERNKALSLKNEDSDGNDYVEVYDYHTGKKKRVRKMFNP